MKKIILPLILLMTFGVHAQSRYFKTMEKNIQLLDSARTTDKLLEVSSSFERIAETEKNKWLPYYYAALAQTRIGLSKDNTINKDQVAQKAVVLAQKGEAIEKNGELCSIQSMAATIQMLVDPQTRWQEFGTRASKAIEEGLQLDPSNPRLYYLKGSIIFNTPAFLNGGKSKAKPFFEKALELYSSTHVEPLYPSWGKNATEHFLKRCE
ncbi:tetratricopeptide repeat protein [Sphingobacterium kitahiroshimense]|uniref:Tetratricopeptide repeat protein n=1 Tax=Sphingobacterium kitahiroshimense TaxID=470446 RepID=A0ABV0BTY7_9SPHI